MEKEGRKKVNKDIRMHRFEKLGLCTMLGIMLILNILLIIDKNNNIKNINEETLKNLDAQIEAQYLEQEENLIIEDSLSRDILLKYQSEESERASGSIKFIFSYSASDCFNCLETEIPKLNKIEEENPGSVYGYYGNYNIDMLERMMELVTPLFSVTPLDSSVVSKIITPTILVVNKDGNKVLDSHVPIPNDFRKSDAFYARWNRMVDIQTHSVK